MTRQMLGQGLARGPLALERWDIGLRRRQGSQELIFAGSGRTPRRPVPSNPADGACSRNAGRKGCGASSRSVVREGRCGPQGRR